MRRYGAEHDDDTYVSTYPNRTLCEALDEMRKSYETRNFSYMLGLIEEIQTYANRMEAALSCQRDFKRMDEALHKLKKEYKEIREKVLKVRKNKGKKNV